MTCTRNFDCTINCEKDDLEERIATLTAEVAALKKQIAEGDEAYEAQHAKFDGCPHAQMENAICGCSYDRKDDVCMQHAPQLKNALAENIALKAEIARRDAPVTDAEMERFRKDYEACESTDSDESDGFAVNKLILARATPPQSGGKE